MRKIFYNLTNIIKKSIITFLIILSFQFNIQDLKAITMNDTDGNIIEELRLSVPLRYKEAWIKAEKEIWEPWLYKQEGFMGRQIFYNKEKEEALLLVNWKNKKLWKNIKSEDVNKIQDIFEKNVMESLKIETNPFVFIYEGELLKQK
tara:strand:- start:2345 stop:2785 length:441 start_codon:yes stop_codon:yes gene_type:complete